MEQASYFEVTKDLQKTHDRLIEMCAEHWVLHGCNGTCEDYKNNMKLLEYTSMQLVQIQISFRRDYFYRFERHKDQAMKGKFIYHG